MISVAIIPAYNEEETIGVLVKSLVDMDFRVVVVDDGSADQTGDKALMAGAKVVRHHQNQGVARAVSTGIKEALKYEPTFIVQLDGDGQHKVEQISKLIHPLSENEADMTIGSRYLANHSNTNQPFIKTVGNKICTSITSRICHMKLTDSQSGFRAYRREVVEQMDFTSGLTYVQEMIIRAVKNNFEVKEVPIDVHPRRYGKSKVVKSSLRYGLNVLVDIVRLYRDFKPIKFFGLSGLSLIGLGGLLALRHIILYQSLGYSPRIFSLIVMLMLVLTGLQIILFGFLADMKR